MQEDQQKAEKWHQKHLQELREGHHQLHLGEVGAGQESSPAYRHPVRGFPGNAQEEEETSALNLGDEVAVGVEVFRIRQVDENSVLIFHEEGVPGVHIRVEDLQLFQPHKISKSIHWCSEESGGVYLHKELN